MQNEFIDAKNETITDRINRATKILQKAVKGSETQVFKDDELTKVSSDLLNDMIKNKIWLKKN